MARESFDFFSSPVLSSADPMWRNKRVELKQFPLRKRTDIEISVYSIELVVKSKRINHFYLHWVDVNLIQAIKKTLILNIVVNAFAFFF